MRLLIAFAVAALASSLVQAADEILVVTNRNKQQAKGCGAFGHERDKTLAFLAAERLTDGSCRVTPLPVVDDGALFAALKERLRGSERGVVVFLHGSGQDFSDMLEKASGISRRYQVQVLALDWPMGKRTGDYKAALAKAGGSGIAFGAVLNGLVARIASDPELKSRSVDVFAHSMGNYVLQRMVQDSGVPASFATVRRVIVNAADVMLAEHRAWLEQLTGRGVAVYVVVNRNDQIIRCASGLGGFGVVRSIACGMGISNEVRGARLGNTIPDQDRADLATYLDFTSLKDMKKKHEYYLGSPPSAGGVYERLFRAGGKEVNFDGIPHKSVSDAGVIIFQ